MKIILASKSPRRKSILSMIVKDFEIMISDEDEVLDSDLTIEDQIKKLAYIKAKNIFDKTEGDRIIIGADTIVIGIDGEIYGKPKDKEDAKKILNKLKNTKHNVITGISILIEKDGKYIEYSDYDLAEVYISEITNDEINNWLSTGEAYDKAGAYAIQGDFAKHIEKINGNYYTVMGLPIHKVYNILKKYIDIK